jgi:hypothetical protein
MFDEGNDDPTFGQVHSCIIAVDDPILAVIRI